jgi:hypothetical protein
VFKINCLEGLTALAIGGAAIFGGHVDPGLTAGAAVGLSAILTRFRENAKAQGLDSNTLLDRMRLAVFRDADRFDDTEASRLALIEVTIDQYRLAYDAAQMAHWLAEQVRAEQGTLTAATLFPIIEKYRNNADIKGLRLEMDVANALCERAVGLAASDWDRGAAQTWLGITTSDQASAAVVRRARRCWRARPMLMRQRYESARSRPWPPLGR